MKEILWSKPPTKAFIYSQRVSSSIHTTIKHPSPQRGRKKRWGKNMTILKSPIGPLYIWFFTLSFNQWFWNKQHWINNATKINKYISYFHVDFANSTSILPQMAMKVSIKIIILSLKNLLLPCESPNFTSFFLFCLGCSLWFQSYCLTFFFVADIIFF